MSSAFVENTTKYKMVSALEKPDCNSDLHAGKLEGICHHKSHPGCHNRDIQTAPKVNLFSLLLNVRITLAAVLPSPPSVGCLFCLFPLSHASVGIRWVTRHQNKQIGGWQTCGAPTGEHFKMHTDIRYANLNNWHVYLHISLWRVTMAIKKRYNTQGGWKVMREALVVNGNYALGVLNVKGEMCCGWNRENLWLWIRGTKRLTLSVNRAEISFLVLFKPCFWSHWDQTFLSGASEYMWPNG